MIWFDDGAMTFPEEELPDVAKAAHEVVQEAKAAGGWVLGAGLESQRASVVATDGTVSDGPYPESREHLGGFAVVDVRSREEGVGVGCQDRRGLPLCARGARARARPDRLNEEICRASAFCLAGGLMTRVCACTRAGKRGNDHAIGA